MVLDLVPGIITGAVFVGEKRACVSKVRRHTDISGWNGDARLPDNANWRLAPTPQVAQDRSR